MDQHDPRRLRTLHLFAGAGGGLLADLLLDHRPVCAVEIDPYCQRVLMQRQADGHLPWFPIWDDVRTFDGHPWRGRVDVVAGGFPCQDLSNAGKRQGLSGARSGLWSEFARLIGEIRPRYAFIENVPDLAVRGLDRMLSDLAALGMDARWCCLGAADVGAPHIRKRLWILATDAHGNRAQRDQSPHRERRGLMEACTDVAHANQKCQRRLPCRTSSPYSSTCLSRTAMGHPDEPRADAQPAASRSWRAIGESSWWDVEPDVGRVAHRVDHRVDRLKAIGNGQVPLCAATAWRILIALVPPTQAGGTP